MPDQHSSEQVILGSQESDPAVSVSGYKRQRKGRYRRITVRFTEEEYAQLAAGARSAGWTVAGWTAASGLAAAQHRLGISRDQ